MADIKITSKVVARKNERGNFGKTINIIQGGNSGGSSDTAKYADKAYTLDENTPVWDWFLDANKDDTATGIINFLNGIRIAGNLIKRILKGEGKEKDISDEDIMTGLRVLAEIAKNNDKLKEIFLRKDQDDRTPHSLGIGENLEVGGTTTIGSNATIGGTATINGKTTTRAGIQIGESFIPGILTGKGGLFDQYANGEIESLIVRRFLEVPLLIYNRVDIKLGDKWRAPGAGIIKTVDFANKLCVLKLEDGEIGAVAVGDICMGIYHSYKEDENATEDFDDSKGNRKFAGFCTVYFTITEVIGDKNEQFKYQLRPVSSSWQHSFEPFEMMTFVAYGSFTNKDRQTSVYETRTYTRMLWRQNTWEIGVENIAMQWGDMTNMNVHGMEMQGYSLFVNNAYVTGTITQIKPDGTPVHTVNFRQEWKAGIEYDYYDSVTYNGSTWVCVNEDGTTSQPGSNNDWLETAQKGESVSNLGDWRSGMVVPYLGIVRMGSSSWMCNVPGGTSNPPLWCWTDENGNYLTYDDGGYCLYEGENTAEYELLASDGLQGAQGDRGEEGIPGTPGKDGKTTYFHIKYSAVEHPTADQMTETPDIYIGTYVDFTKEDSVDPASYTWARFRGLQGEKGEQGIPGIGVDGKTYYLHIKYSNDGGKTFTGNNGEDSGSYIGVLTDLNVNDSNIPANYKWSLIKGDKGDKGESVSNLGDWRSGMVVPYLGIVRMGSSSWMCNVPGGTSNPPLWCWTDENGNYLTYDDGGYCLYEGENTAEYELVASDGGKGNQGIQGCIIRRGEWSIGVEWRNDEKLTNGTRYLDVALIRDNGVATGWKAYKCKLTHISSVSNAPGNSTYWEEFGLNTTAIFTSLIIAKDSHIDFMQGNQLLIKKDDNTVTAGISGSQKGDKIRLWVGSDIPENAPYRVDEYGALIAKIANISGKLTAESLSMKKIPVGGSLNDGYMILASDGVFIAPELKEGEVKEVRFTTPSGTRTPAQIILRPENGNIKIGRDEWLIDAVSSDVTIDGIGYITGFKWRSGNDNYTYWIISNN